MTLLSQGTTRVILPSKLATQIPKVPLDNFLSYVIWLPATKQILFFTFGLSFLLIVSDQEPVQFATYLQLILYYLFVNKSLKITPVIFSFSFMKSINYARFNIFAGLKVYGILMPLPSEAVNKAVRHSLESLKEPSS